MGTEENRGERMTGYKCGGNACTQAHTKQHESKIFVDERWTNFISQILHINQKKKKHTKVAQNRKIPKRRQNVWKKSTVQKRRKVQQCGNTGYGKGAPRKSFQNISCLKHIQKPQGLK